MTAYFTVMTLALAAPPDALELKDGDRIVWLGGTLVEREQLYGHWETALHLAFPKTKFIVRNLGWSGDTVFGDSRAVFDTPKQGFERLIARTLEQRPSVIFIHYGSNESFEREAGLKRFEGGLAKLLKELAPAKARIVLFSPIPFESGPAAKFNDALKTYTEAISSAAEKGGHRFADLGYMVHQHRMASSRRDYALTDNGVHLHEKGYLNTAHPFLRSMGIFADLSGGNPEPLRQAILAKNELFFHRWRPQNETYLFGFRKHEQGNNAKDIPAFDPLIEKMDQQIIDLKLKAAK